MKDTGIIKGEPTKENGLIPVELGDGSLIYAQWIPNAEPVVGQAVDIERTASGSMLATAKNSYNFNQLFQKSGLQKFAKRASWDVDFANGKVWNEPMGKPEKGTQGAILILLNTLTNNDLMFVHCDGITETSKEINLGNYRFEKSLNVERMSGFWFLYGNYGESVRGRVNQYYNSVANAVYRINLKSSPKLSQGILKPVKFYYNQQGLWGGSLFVVNTVTGKISILFVEPTKAGEQPEFKFTDTDIDFIDGELYCCHSFGNTCILQTVSLNGFFNVETAIVSKDLGLTSIIGDKTTSLNSENFSIEFPNISSISEEEIGVSYTTVTYHQGYRTDFNVGHTLVTLSNSGESIKLNPFTGSLDETGLVVTIDSFKFSTDVFSKENYLLKHEDVSKKWASLRTDVTSFNRKNLTLNDADFILENNETPLFDWCFYQTVKTRKEVSSGIPLNLLHPRSNTFTQCFTPDFFITFQNDDSIWGPGQSYYELTGKGSINWDLDTVVRGQTPDWVWFENNNRIMGEVFKISANTDRLLTFSLTGFIDIPIVTDFLSNFPTKDNYYFLSSAYSVPVND